MIKTMGVQHLDFANPSVYLFLEAMDDILRYLNQEIIIDNSLAFFDRVDLSLEDPFEGTMKMKQYWVNGILISGLLEQLDNDEFIKNEEKFNNLVSSVCSSLEQKLKLNNLNDTHEVYVDRDEDYGDVVVTFWKKGSD